jgi:hypothetical protein
VVVVVVVARRVVVVRGAFVTAGGGACVVVVSGAGATVVVVVASVVVVVDSSTGAAPGTDEGGRGCGEGKSTEALLPVSEKAAARNTVPETKRIEAHTVVSARLFDDFALSPPPKGFWRLTGEKKVDINDAQFPIDVVVRSVTVQVNHSGINKLVNLCGLRAKLF